MATDLETPGEWRRVSRSTPCVVCGKPDWCVYTDSLALCMRIESSRASKGDAGGWLHARGQAPLPRRRGIRLVKQVLGTDFEHLAHQFATAMTEERLMSLAEHLGVSVESLVATGAGWCASKQAWSWPMYDNRQRVVGVRLRDARTHQKYAVRGSKQGVFLAECAHHLVAASWLMITEGPTDLCAASDLGFTGIGRPSCSGGTKQVAALTRGRHVVVVADRDVAGRRGGQALVTALLPTVLSARTIEPPAPHKDLRAWLQAGADHDALQVAIDAATPQTLRVRIVR